MNVQEFINVMEANSNSRHVASAPWFYHVKNVTVVEDNNNYGVYFVQYHDLNFPAKHYLVGVLKNNAVVFKIEISRQEANKQWIEDYYTALADLRYNAMVTWTYKFNTFEVFFGHRGGTTVEISLDNMLEKMYAFIRRGHEIFDAEPLEQSFRQYFERNSTFRKKNLELKLENGTKLVVERLRVFNWETKEIETSFKISKKDDNALLSFKETVVSVSKTINVEAPSKNGRAISHNQLYNTCPEFKGMIDRVFGEKY